MKKISLKSIKAEELLSKEELKQIMGGNEGSGGGDDYQVCRCGANADCYVIGKASRTCTDICKGSGC